MWTNPLDKVPQIPVDWANHISQGGLGTVAMIAVQLAVLLALGHPFGAALVFATTLRACYLMTAVSCGKKLLDFIKVGPPNESAGVCIGKAIVTVLWPWSLVLAQLATR
jgi:hypothetical protein